MKTKAQVILLVLCFFYIQNKAQVYFNNRYDGSGSCDGTNSVDTFQNKYLSVTDECNSISFYNLSVRLFNQDGTTYKKKRIVG